MLQWQHLFSTAILQRGREYYKKNKVRSLIQDGDLYYASVEGTEEYEVQIRIQGDRLDFMSCECPYAQDGNRCKHMAATLYEIAAREIPGIRSEKKTRSSMPGHVKINPFAETANPGEYRYYMPERFTRNIEIYADTYRKAQKLLEDGALHDIEVQNCYSTDRGSGGKVLVATGYLKSGSFYPVRISVSRDRVIGMNCPVYGCRGYYANYVGRENTEICEHCLALLLKTVEELQGKSYWDATDQQARRLLDSFWSRYRNTSMTAAVPDEAEEVRKPGRTVRLDPRIEDTDDGLTLGFRIGTDEKLYVLRNPEGLVEAVQTEGEFPLGSKGSLDFSADTFGETDRKWYDLIRQAVLEKQHHEEENYGRPKKLQGITLYGALLDDFYELARGSRVERKTGGGKTG